METIIQQILEVALPLIIGLIAPTSLWAKSKLKISQIRSVIDEVDDALRDDKITEQEFRTIFSSFKALTKN